MTAHPLFTRKRLLSTLLIALTALAVLLAAAPRAFLTSSTADRALGAGNAACDSYKVQRGDTLKKIAARFDMTVKELARANNLRVGAKLRVGQRLCIPKAWPPPEAAIEMFSPVAKGIYHSPIEVIGNSLTFEGVVNMRLSLTDGTVLAERYAMGGGTEHEFFHTYLRFETFYDDAELRDAVLEVFEVSAKDGSEINKVSIPITVETGQRSIDVLEPEVGAKVCNPITVEGYSLTFEGAVHLVAQRRNGATLVEGSGMGGGTEYRDWNAELGPINAPVRAVLVSVLDHSARDGQAIDETRIPVTLLPRGSKGCP